MAEPKRVTKRAKGGFGEDGSESIEQWSGFKADRIIEGRPRLGAWEACATPHATAEAAPRNLHQSSLGRASFMIPQNRLVSDSP